MIEPTEIKHPFAVLIEDCVEETFSIWWEQSDGTIAFFDHIPENYPAYTLGLFKSKEEAIKRLREMTEKEGWILAGGEARDMLKEMKNVTK